MKVKRRTEKIKGFLVAKEGGSDQLCPVLAIG